MKVVKVLRRRPAMFFRLSGIRLADFDDLVAKLHPIWLCREEQRLSSKTRQRGGRSELSTDVCRAITLVPYLLPNLHQSGFRRAGVWRFVTNGMSPRTNPDVVDGGAFPNSSATGQAISGRAG